MKYELKKRINNLKISDYQEMSPGSVSILTEGFKEEYIKYILSRWDTKREQKRLIGILREKYIDKRFDAPLGVPLSGLSVPAFFDEMELDIDCGELINLDGDIQPITRKEMEDIIEQEGFLPTIYHQIPLAFDSVEEEVEYLRELLEEDSKEITTLQEEINRLKGSGEEYQEPASENGVASDEDKVSDGTLESFQERNSVLEDKMATCEEKKRGLSPQQAALFVHALAEFCKFTTKRKRDDLAPMVSQLFGWGKKSAYNKMTEGYQGNDREAVATIFDTIWPEFASFLRTFDKLH